MHPLHQLHDVFFPYACIVEQGHSQDFSKGGSHCVKMRVFSPDCHYGQGIVMAFSPPVGGCLVEKGLQKGGVTGTPGTPWLRPCCGV